MMSDCPRSRAEAGLFEPIGFCRAVSRFADLRTRPPAFEQTRTRGHQQQIHHKMKTHRITAIVASVAAAFILIATELSAVATPKAAPAQSNAHGHSLAEWLVRYFEWLVGDGPIGGNGLTFLPLPAGEYVSGSFSLEDPGVLEGELEVALKPGQSFMLPIAVWQGEFYADGGEDAVVPDSSMNRSEFFVTIDGKTVAEKEAGVKSPLYVPVTRMLEPVYYDEPTSYGSIGASYVQGFAMVHGPLTPGRHVMKLHSTLFAENYGLAAVYENTWIITVK